MGSFSLERSSKVSMINTFWFSFMFYFFSGKQTIDLIVEEGGPLPFAFDILTTAFQYGNRAFTHYPSAILDYFKQSFPEGFSWERTMAFQDEGFCDVKNDITLVICKADDFNCYDLRRSDYITLFIFSYYFFI